MQGIIHAHPTHLSAMSLAVDNLGKENFPETLQVLGKSLRIEGYDIQDSEITSSLLTAFTNGNIIVIPQDGVLVVGRDLEHAYEQLAEVEHAAEIYTTARSARFI